MELIDLSIIIHMQPIMGGVTAPVALLCCALHTFSI